MKKLLQLHLLFSWLSLDVVIGAMASMYFFQELVHVQLEWPTFVLLALAVWTIYSLDHLLDARQSKASSSPRRVFYSQNKSVLTLGILIAMVLGLVGAFYWLGWDTEVQLTFALLLVLGGCRWAIQKLGPLMLKEVSIALFYVIGSLWLPMLRSEVEDLSWKALVFVAVFFLLALLNLWMLSFLDREEDRQDGFISIAVLFSPNQMIQWIRKLAFFGIFGTMAAFIFLPSFYRPFSCVLLLMFLVHYLTFFQSELSVTQKRQRMELSFWIPWLLLWI
ncbi:MAG: hypothetical protein O2829_01420 [Bacteroidetes bacterium]|nr:hypothetical protein [Bacteroidota bacterium]